MKKRFKVVAYKSTRWEKEVKAESAEEAMDIARDSNLVDPAWRHDPEYYGFDVVDAEEEEEEDE